jgi:hypothetical protein
MTALHVHVVAAALSLPACLLLLSKTIMRRAPRVHRYLGRVVGCAVLFALVPSGAWLAWFAKGGWPSTVGFLASGAIVAFAMVRAIGAARARDYVAHRRYVLHVVAQMSVAVTSRAMLIGLDAAGMDPDVAYLVALWIPVVASALLAEMIAAGAHAPPARRPREIAVLPRVLLAAPRQPDRLGGAA